MICKLPFLALNIKVLPHHCVKTSTRFLDPVGIVYLLLPFLPDTRERYTTVTHKVSCKNRHKIETFKNVSEITHYHTFGLKYNSGGGGTRL